MVDDKKKRLHPHKTSESDDEVISLPSISEVKKKRKDKIHGAIWCTRCNAFTIYGDLCAICQISAVGDENNLKYRGMYEPYERLLYTSV